MQDLYTDIDPAMVRYIRIETNIASIQARLRNPRVPEPKKELLRLALAAQQSAAQRLAFLLQAAPGQIVSLDFPKRREAEASKLDESLHPNGYGHGV